MTTTHINLGGTWYPLRSERQYIGGRGYVDFHYALLPDGRYGRSVTERELDEAKRAGRVRQMEEEVAA